jgi:hypothetical protein
MIDFAMAAEAVSSSASTPAITDYVSIIIPLVVNALLVAYLFGSLTQRIKALEADMTKLQFELEKVKDAHDRAEGNIHRVEIVLSRIEARFDVYFTTVAESAKCPMIKETATKMSGKL